MKIEPTARAHLQGMIAVLENTELFPPEMLADMAEPFLEGAEDVVWLTATQDHQVIGLCFAKAEELTDGTWNMLALGVLDAHRGMGAGRALVEAMETHMVATGQRLLIVDTSSLPAFDDARAFYKALGYRQEAIIQDYWAQDDSKVTYAKALNPPVK